MEISSVKMPRLGEHRLLAGSLFFLVLIALALATFKMVRTYIIAGLPYSDSFAKGGGDEWKAFGGTWQLVDGSMRNDSDERGAKLIAGSNRWRDYSLEADIMLLGRDGDAGLIARSNEEEQGGDIPLSALLATNFN
jgi:hypothetical protein